MARIVIAAVLTIFLGIVMCTREYSREDVSVPSIDTLPPVNTDTVLNKLVYSYRVEIQDNTKIKKIYIGVMTKKWPNQHKLIDSILLNTTGSSVYLGEIDLAMYLTMSLYSKGDVFHCMCEIRFRDGGSKQVSDTTLIY